MNAVEFLFALFAVFGSTGLWFLWVSFVYNLDKSRETELVKQAEEKETINQLFTLLGCAVTDN